MLTYRSRLARAVDSMQAILMELGIGLVSAARIRLQSGDPGWRVTVSAWRYRHSSEYRHTRDAGTMIGALILASEDVIACAEEGDDG